MNQLLFPISLPFRFSRRKSNICFAFFIFFFFVSKICFTKNVYVET